MKVYQQVAGLLTEYGVRTMFGLLGDANMYVASAFEDSGGRFVRVTHESGAVGMADAHARMTGNWAVASVTHGPGFTNTLTALVEAARFGSPVLLITGDPPPEPTHMQRLDIGALCAAVGVVHERIHRPETVQRDLARAVRRLESTCAPVVLNIPVPIAVSTQTIEPTHGGPPAARTASRPTPDEDALDAALGVAASALRPVIVAGRGVIAADAESAIVELADTLGAALFTSGLGIGLFTSHPRHLGIMGGISHEEATQILTESDCVIAVGTSLNKYTALGGELVAGKSLVHIDADPVKLGWLATPTAGVCGDARVVVDMMTEALTAANLPDKTEWKRRGATAAAVIADWTPTDDRTTADTVDIRVATQRINALLPAGCAVVSDVGRFIAGSWPYLTCAPAGRFTAMTGFGSIGLGLAAGTGAAVSGVAPLTVVLVGDGGFMMHASELATAVRENLPMLILVFNDAAYGAEYQKLINEGFRADHAYNQWPDIASTATALGADALTVTGLGDLEALGKAVDDIDKPLVVDIRLDPTHHLFF